MFNNFFYGVEEVVKGIKNEKAKNVYRKCHKLYVYWKHRIFWKHGILMIVFRLKKEKIMNTRNYKVYSLALAIIAAISLSLAPVAVAETGSRTAGDVRATSGGTTTSSTSSSTASQSEADRNAAWYSYTTVNNPLLGISYNQGAYGPDSGIGQTGQFSNFYSPVSGSTSTGSQSMTYAGGLPVYTGAGSPFATMNYGAMTGMVNSMSGLPSYNTAAGYGGLGGYGTTYGGLGGYGNTYGGLGGYGTTYGGLGGYGNTYGGLGGYGTTYGGLGGYGTTYGGLGGYGNTYGGLGGYGTTYGGLGGYGTSYGGLGGYGTTYGGLGGYGTTYGGLGGYGTSYGTPTYGYGTPAPSYGYYGTQAPTYSPYLY